MILCHAFPKFYAILCSFGSFFMPFYAIFPSNFMFLCHEIHLLFILSGPRIQVLILANLPTYSQVNRGLPVIIREIWKLGELDQVEDEGLVDKIADLGLWPFFSSYASKL